MPSSRQIGHLASEYVVASETTVEQDQRFAGPGDFKMHVNTVHVGVFTHAVRGSLA
jgi:hypothetical protein